jgi:hypothetical protein
MITTHVSTELPRSVLHELLELGANRAEWIPDPASPQGRGVLLLVSTADEDEHTAILRESVAYTYLVRE